MRTFRYMYINYYNGLRLFADVSKNYKNDTILGNLRTITQQGKNEERQMTKFVSYTFCVLTVCDIYFCI